MAAAYPNSVKVFNTHVNITEIIDAGHPNTLQEEVVAIESTLGTNPNLSTAPSPSGTFVSTSTSFSSVSARLANLETGVVADTHTQYIRKAADVANVIEPAATTTKGLVVKAAVGQTANLQEWQTSDGSGVTVVHENGALSTIAPIDAPYVRNIYLSTLAPSGGNNGDVWLKYS